MEQHRIIEYLDHQVIFDQVLTHPALAGIALRGFLLSDDKRACIIIEPVGGENR